MVARSAAEYLRTFVVLRNHFALGKTQNTVVPCSSLIRYLEHLENSAFRDTAKPRQSIPNNRSIKQSGVSPKDFLNLGKAKRDTPEILNARQSFVFGDTGQHVKNTRVAGRQ
jgi:hypothetical protein